MGKLNLSVLYLCNADWGCWKSEEIVSCGKGYLIHDQKRRFGAGDRTGFDPEKDNILI